MIKVTIEENERIETLTEKMNMKKSRLLRNIVLGNIGDAEFFQNIGLLPLIKKVNELKNKLKGI